MTNNEEFKQLTADALNAKSTRDAALIMARSKLGHKYLPICPSDHKGVTEQHANTCKRPGKTPRISNWQIKASDDPTTIRDWFQFLPDSNLGMITGGRHGIIGFDADGEYGIKKMEELFDGCIPITWQFSTPGGGMRYFFGVPRGPSLRKYTDVSPDGGHQELAFLADGQMTVLPPSRHQNGGQYLWLEGRGPGDVALADLPDEILEKFSPSRTAESLSLDNEDGEHPNTTMKDVKSAKLKNRFGSTLEKHSPATPAVSDPDLQKLMNKCEVVRKAVAEQAGVGCNENLWHSITSMLVRADCTEAALTFSKGSSKHDSHSERRIRLMEAEGEHVTYGPTRCMTLGCDGEQIARCHGSINKDKQTGEISNSPAAFLAGTKLKSSAVLPDYMKDKEALLPSRYSLEGKNLCVVQTDKEGNRNDIPLANFFAWINKTVVKDDGSEQKRFYELEGVLLHSRKRLQPIHVAASDFESMKWLEQWGPEPNIQPGNKVRDTVRHAIQTTASGATKERVYAHLGWVKVDGAFSYLHAAGAVGATAVRVEIDPRLRSYNLPTSSGDRKEAMKASLNLLDIAPHRVTLPLWGLAFLSPMCEWLRTVGLEPKFLMWLHGYTGTRKTTLAKLFTCHFGDLLERPPASFKDTANSVEKRGFDVKDSLLLIDDYHPTSSPREAKSMSQLAEQILRTYGDRVGRGRMRQDTSLRPDYPPRGMAIVTAEDVLDRGSSISRLFPVELRQGDLDLNKLTIAQQQSPLLSQAMVGYLEWLGQSMSQIDYQLREIFLKRRNEASRLHVHGRLVEAAAWLHLGLQLGLDYAESVGAIEPGQKNALLQEAWEGFVATANEQGEQVAEVKATKRFVDILSELLANRTIYTEATRPLSQGDIPRSGTHVGWHDSNYFYFLPDVLYNAVCRFLSAQGSHFPISSQTLWKQLAEEGLTLTETSKEHGKERRHNLVKKTVGGQRSRKLCVKADVLRGRADEELQPRTRPERSQPESRQDLTEVFAPENGGIAP